MTADIAVPAPPTADELARLSTLPRDRDGPVFDEPWQARAFAIVVSLQRRGAITWTEWADEIGRVIASAGREDDGSRYYEFWLEAAEKLLVAKGLIAPGDLVAKG